MRVVVHLTRERGFSLAEMLIVMGVMAVMFSMAAGVTMSAVNSGKADGSTSELVNILELARNQTTSQRRDFQLVFTAPNEIRLIRLEVPNGSTPIATRYLEGGQTFFRFTPLGDTPDAFGGGTGAIAFGTTPTIRFTTDGSLVDSSGDILNGTLFLAVPENVASARAVTIFGASGLIRVWKWNGTTWVS